MIDKRAFERAEKDGICLIENNNNQEDKWLLVRVAKDNKRVTMIGDVLMIDLGGEE